MTFNRRKMISKIQMDLNNEDDLKNKKDLHIAGRHMALDIFRFAVFFLRVLVIVKGYHLAYGPHIGPAIKWKGLA